MSGPATPARVGDALSWARDVLREAGIDTPRDDAQLLLGELLGTGRAGLLLRVKEELEPVLRETFAQRVTRRAGREPLQHLVGHWPFLELDLLVDRRALVPRPETEDVALVARRLLPADRETQVADVGTGGGCLALALAHSHPLARLVAIDNDPAALELAAANLQAGGFGERVSLVHGDLLQPVPEGTGLDLVVANLPYVSPAEYAGLQPEVRLFDPPQALIAEQGGTLLIRRLVEQAPARVRAGGAIVLEAAPGQMPELAAELAAGPWDDITVAEDRFGRPRVLHARRA
ncbi:MAG: peptide chain release factor N(5)-glutamine methyltransferase [Acidobacteria bacterium]|nr:peptide chain release factor N(5)-glutamine methyltransferase [Acidobacteriota bacterium]